MKATSLPLVHQESERPISAGLLAEAIQKHVAKALYRIELVSSGEPLDFLMKLSRHFDLLIVGTAKVGLLERVAVGPSSSQIVRHSECSVAVVKVAGSVKKLLNV